MLRMYKLLTPFEINSIVSKNIMTWTKINILKLIFLGENMKILKSLILLSLILTSSVSMAKNPHDSDSSNIDNQHMQGKILAAEYEMLSNEIVRLEKKLSSTLDTLPFNLERNEGKIIALISNQIERDLEQLKKDIEKLSYKTSSNKLHEKLIEIEKDIEMI